MSHRDSVVKRVGGGRWRWDPLAAADIIAAMIVGTMTPER
jgi:hypothetical protein